MSDYVRRVDEAAPPPTSRADAVCRCTYDGPVRAYRCVACQTGYGPDRAFLGTVLADADFAAIRATVRADAQRYVRAELDRCRAERIAAARRAPWWRRWLALWWASA